MSKLKTRGEGNAQAKLTRVNVEAIRLLNASGVMGYRKLAKIYSVSVSQIHRIIKRENWAWL